MGRKVYTTPMTNLYQVELEGAFASSIVGEKNPGVRSTGHETAEIDLSSGFEWNDGGWDDKLE